MSDRLGRFALLCAGIVFAGHLLDQPLFGGKAFRGGPDAVRWRDGRLRLEISRAVHTGGDAGVAAEESVDRVHRAVADAIRAWAGERAGLEIEVGYTPETAVASGVNLVTFTDTAPFDNGTCDPAIFIACTVLRYDELSGEILGAAVAFNPYKRHSASGIAATHDIGLVMLHEMGHVLGLDHSAVLNSVMAAEVELEPGSAPRAIFPLRQLSSDDRLTIAALYRPGELSRIEGSVTEDGASVAGAHVIAIDRGGHPTVGAFTAADGSYSLAVPSGEYLLAVEPLDGPVVPGQFFTVRDAAAPFPTLFWSVDGGSAAEGEWIVAEDGVVREAIGFAIRRRPVVNAATVGVIENGAYWGAARTQIAQGATYTLGVTRNPDDGPGSLGLLGEGWRLDGAATSPSAAPQLLRQKLSANSDPGAYVLAYRNESGVSLLAGGVTVVRQPKVESAFVDGVLVITGSDLAAAELAAEEHAGAGDNPLPGPSQLGGVAVRSQGRWLPLRAVGPGMIIADAPAPDAGEVAVVTGAGVETTVKIAR
ncbi:MAG: matrixin family metalloprotease [Bryobacteraceae bacterium]